MIGRETPYRTPQSPPTWGTVRGQNIHMACATEEELSLTWLRFASPEVAPDQKCRCGVALANTPDP